MVENLDSACKKLILGHLMVNALSQKKRQRARINSTTIRLNKNSDPSAERNGKSRKKGVARHAPLAFAFLSHSFVLFGHLLLTLRIGQRTGKRLYSAICVKRLTVNVNIGSPGDWRPYLPVSTKRRSRTIKPQHRLLLDTGFC